MSFAPSADAQAGAPARIDRRVSPVWLAAGAACFVIGVLLALFPLGVGRDYPNRLALAFLETALADTPALQTYFELQVKPVTHLGMDVVVAALSPLLGHYGAGAASIWLAATAGPVAGVLLSRRVHGDAAGWLPLLGFAAAFNACIQWGFISFSLSAGLALLAFAGWTASAPGWRRTLVFAPVSLCLAFAHGLGFLLFGYLTLLYELARFTAGARGEAPAFVRGLLTRTTLAYLPGLGLIAAGMATSTDLPKGGAFEFTLQGKIEGLFAALNFGSWTLAALLTPLVIALLVAGVRRGVLVFDRDLGLVCAGLARWSRSAPSSCSAYGACTCASPRRF